MAFDGVLSANATFGAAGKFGKSLSGGNALIPGGILTGLTEMTLEGWVKSSTNAVQCAMGVSGVLWMGIDANGMAVAKVSNTTTYGEDVLTSAAPITDGTWHHIALCIGSGANAGKFYVDGALVGTANVSMHPTGGRDRDMGIRTLPGNGLPWVGEVDDFAIHSYVKYTAPFAVPTTPVPTNTTKLVAVYHFDGDAVNKVGTDPTAPVFTAAPAINGSPRAGDATTYTVGTFTTNEAPVITQQWTLDGADIAGATGATYTPVAGDVGKALRVREIATNSAAPGGVSSTSAPVTILAAVSQNTRTVNITLWANKGLKAANKTGIKVSFSNGTGPNNPGTLLYQSNAETTDANGLLNFTYDSPLIAVGQQGLLMILGAAGEHYIGMVTVA